MSIHFVTVKRYSAFDCCCPNDMLVPLPADIPPAYRAYIEKALSGISVKSFIAPEGVSGSQKQSPNSFRTLSHRSG